MCGGLRRGGLMGDDEGRWKLDRGGGYWKDIKIGFN